MGSNKLKVHFYVGARRHAARDMHSRPMVGDIFALKDGCYLVLQVVWPYSDDHDLDYLKCNVAVEKVNEEGE